MLPELTLSLSVSTHMPSPQLPNYLKSNRKRLSLSQDEVAFLLGTASGAKVCRDERFAREPSLSTALAYEAIYQKPVRELFAGFYEKAEGHVLVRAKGLRVKLNGKKMDRQTKQKLQAVGRIIGDVTEVTLNS